MLDSLHLDAVIIRYKPLLFPLRQSTGVFYEPFRRFIRFSLIALCVISLGIFVLGMTASVGTHCQLTVDCGWDMIGWLMLAAVLVAIPIDFICLSTTVTVFSGMVRSGEWDLLYLTAQDEVALMEARYTIALARVWRLLALATNFRIAVVLCVLFWLAWLNRDATLLLTIPIASLFLSAFVLEPRWRIHALAAIGLAVSARTRQHASSVLVGMFILFLVFALQMGIVVVLYWTLLQDMGTLICCPTVYVSIVALLYFGYRLITNRTLAYATRRMACCADDLR